MDENKIVVKDGDNVIIYNVLFTLDDEVSKKQYVAYSDNSVDEEGAVIIHVSIKDPKTGELVDITDPEEKKMIEKAMKSVEEAVRESQS